jgi:FSR family fosmidomycin resistance protein-like MFS transporter
MTHLRDRHFVPPPAGRRPAGILTFLLVEYFDELAFTIIGVAMPLLRDNLGLDYAQIGLLFGIPSVLAAVLEPPLLLLGDTPLRARLIRIGGLLLGLAFLFVGAAQSFAALLLALTVSYPASGAFVGLSQATMIERHPTRESEMMARWTASGTLGSLSGPLLFAGMLALGLHWRSPFILTGAACLGLTTLVGGAPSSHTAPLNAKGLIANLRMNLATTIQVRGLWRWLVLLPLSDLMLDVFFGYIALFLTDVIGLPPATAAVAVTIWLLGFLVGQFLLARRLATQAPDRVIRWTAAATVILFPLWLAAPLAPVARLGLLFVLGLLAAPWYPLLQGEAFATAPGRAATVSALSSVTGTVGGVLAVLTGMAAASLGLTVGMGLLLLGPVALIIFTPRRGAAAASPAAE